ncbi:peptidase inhibitor family I36 protein [Streptomyces racemochromogenes]|uniref:Peptidase inhibitor family I36 protein n=1 Tax=Streptomyces racemochromogenes TaxID=67353 RepID=A0ABW7PI39_9ACTN
MRSTRIVFAVAAAAGAMLITAPSAGAATPSSSASPDTGTLSPAAEQQMRGEIAASKPVIATYKGKKIDLSQGWQGAQVCAEGLDGQVSCFGSQAEADAALVNENAAVARRENAAGKALGQGTPAQAPTGTRASSDCSFGWVCVWEHSDYSGRRLQWSEKGTKNLSTWGFRDQASSGCVNRYQNGAALVDFRDFMPDPIMLMGAGSCYDFTRIGYNYGGGSWNDKADAVEVY